MINKLRVYSYYGEALMGVALKHAGRKVGEACLKLSVQGFKIARKGDNLQMRGVRKMVSEICPNFVESRE